MALFQVTFSTTEYYTIVVEADSVSLAGEEFHALLDNNRGKLMSDSIYRGYDVNDYTQVVEVKGANSVG